MKIAISGKGGTGKTTVTSLLGYLFASESKKVFLIDTDPDGNLGMTLGFSNEELSGLKPITELKELIDERTENKGTGFFKLNPKVDDIPEKYSIKRGNISLLVLGNPKKGGSGCYCPENTFLKALLNNMLVYRDEYVLLDMPAGIEHLGRGTARSVDMLLVVVEPGVKSIQTAQRILKLAGDLKIKKVYFIGNKILEDKEIKFIEDNLGSDNKPVGYIRYSKEIHEAELSSKPIYELATGLLKELSAIKEVLERTLD